MLRNPAARGGRLITLPFVALVSVAVSCGSEPEPPVEPAAAVETTTAPDRFDFRANVAGMAAERLEVVLDHEEIVGYMAAMTMPFAIESQAILDDVEIGDRVTGVLEVTDGKAVVVELNEVEQVEDPPIVPATPADAEPPPAA